MSNFTKHLFESGGEKEAAELRGIEQAKAINKDRPVGAKLAPGSIPRPAAWKEQKRHKGESEVTQPAGWRPFCHTSNSVHCMHSVPGSVCDLCPWRPPGQPSRPDTDTQHHADAIEHTDTNTDDHPKPNPDQHPNPNADANTIFYAIGHMDGKPFAIVNLNTYDHPNADFDAYAITDCHGHTIGYIVIDSHQYARVEASGRGFVIRSANGQPAGFAQIHITRPGSDCTCGRDRGDCSNRCTDCNCG